MRNAICVGLLALAAQAQTTLSSGSYRIEITLERKGAEGWNAIDPGLVLAQDDAVRFRFHTNFPGFLYIRNRGTSGASTLLFPANDTGRQNRIEAGREYAVPAAQGMFRITGPPGHDVTYWMMSAVRMEPGAELPSATPDPPPLLIPRCDDSIFRARGSCVDNSAGIKARDLDFQREKNRSVISTPAAPKQPVTFEFHVAHR